MAFSTFGELGKEGEDFVSQAVVFHCAKHGLPRAEDKAQFLEQLAVALTRQVGQRLLAASPSPS